MGSQKGCACTTSRNAECREICRFRRKSSIVFNPFARHPPSMRWPEKGPNFGKNDLGSKAVCQSFLAVFCQQSFPEAPYIRCYRMFTRRLICWLYKNRKNRFSWFQRLVTYLTPIFDLHNPPSRPTITQQPFNSYSSILHTHNLPNARLGIRSSKQFRLTLSYKCQQMLEQMSSPISHVT